MVRVCSASPSWGACVSVKAPSCPHAHRMQAHTTTYTPRPRGRIQTRHVPKSTPHTHIHPQIHTHPTMGSLYRHVPKSIPPPPPPHIHPAWGGGRRLWSSTSMDIRLIEVHVVWHPVSTLPHPHTQIDVATPDFSMLYNVIMLASIVLAYFCGTTVNLLARKPRHVPHAPVTVPPLA